MWPVMGEYPIAALCPVFLGRLQARRNLDQYSLVAFWYIPGKQMWLNTDLDFLVYFTLEIN